MSFNYIYKLGKVIKIGIDGNKKESRVKHYKFTAGLMAVALGVPAPDVQTLWIKEGLSDCHRFMLESWMKRKMSGHLAYGSEWFFDNDSVRNFILADPYIQWMKEEQPKKVKLRWSPGVMKFMSSTKNNIIQVYSSGLSMTKNQCRRVIHPERTSSKEEFETIFKNMVQNGDLVPCGKTQRSDIYCLK